MPLLASTRPRGTDRACDHRVRRQLPVAVAIGSAGDRDRSWRCRPGARDAGVAAAHAGRDPGDASPSRPHRRHRNPGRALELPGVRPPPTRASPASTLPAPRATASMAFPNSRSGTSGHTPPSIFGYGSKTRSSSAAACSAPAAVACSKVRLRICMFRCNASSRCRPPRWCSAVTNTPAPTCVLPRSWNQSSEAVHLRALALANAGPSVPFALADELASNVFLRCHLASVHTAVNAHFGTALDAPAEVFAALRRWKNSHV